MRTKKLVGACALFVAASALAAGNPVVVKAHAAHPGTSELVASAVQRAVKRTAFPEGTLSMLQSSGYEVGIKLVQHALTKAVAFTGSLAGGRALFDAAAARSWYCATLPAE